MMVKQINSLNKIDSILSISIKNSGDYFITSDADGSMRVWSIKGPKLLNVIDNAHKSNLSVYLLMLIKSLYILLQ